MLCILQEQRDNNIDIRNKYVSPRMRMDAFFFIFSDIKTTIIKETFNEKDFKEKSWYWVRALKIGQAGEFDYSGSSAESIAPRRHSFGVGKNPNIATIQTSWKV